MKIVFTESEVQEIILAHVRRSLGVQVDKVDISTYKMDEFATVTQSQRLKDELAQRIVVIDDPFKDL